MVPYGWFDRPFLFRPVAILKRTPVTWNECLGRRSDFVDSTYFLLSASAAVGPSVALFFDPVALQRSLGVGSQRRLKY